MLYSSVDFCCFFFSSRRRHTRYWRDWSSDVCSSDLFRGWRWRQTLEPLDAFPKRAHCVDAIFISYAASLVVPRIGEVSRCGVLAKYDDVSFAKSLGTVVTERLVDTLTILLITGITVLLQMPVFATFLHQTGTKIPSLLLLLTSVWF